MEGKFIGSKKRCLLGVSGGLDSYIFYWDLKDRGYEVLPVFCKYGQEYEEIEEKKVAELYSDALIIQMPIPLPFSNLHKTGRNFNPDYIPARNVIILAYLQNMAETIYCYSDNEEPIGVILGVSSFYCAGFPDSKRSFLDSMGAAIKESSDGRVFMVESWLTRVAKKDAVAHAVSLGLSAESMSRTYSCFRGDEVHCGVCHSCMGRKRAFIESHVPDHTEYKD